MPALALLAYDDACGPCSRFRGVVGLLDARRSIGFVSLGLADESGALSAVEPAARYGSFHLVVGGRTSSGADAVIPLLALLLPAGGRVSGALDRLPGSRRAISWGYRTLARFHGTGACSREVG